MLIEWCYNWNINIIFQKEFRDFIELHQKKGKIEKQFIIQEKLDAFYMKLCFDISKALHIYTSNIHLNAAI
jgi:hypothetical protein